MDSRKSLGEKIKIDNNLSNRYIDLDPNGYFIIKVDLEENQIILEHFLNNIDEEGYALDPETNEPIKCDSQNTRVSNEVFKGISAKQLGILITEERNDLITRFDHALYLGRELQKAEECLYKKLPYIQD
jgi:dihydropteroate synthase